LSESQRQLRRTAVFALHQRLPAWLHLGSVQLTAARRFEAMSLN
jgi:hypothetical protein